MRRDWFPWLALGIGLTDALLVLRAIGDPSSEPALPLLTLLFMSEFGVIVCVIGAVAGVRQFLGGHARWGALLAALGCLTTGIALGWLGIGLWQGIAGAVP
jgi:hypothetical protein